MAKTYITWKQADETTGIDFVAPDPGPGNEPDHQSPGPKTSFIHLGFNVEDQLNYGIIMDGYTLPDQHESLECTVVDLDDEDNAELKAKFEQSPGNNRHQMERAMQYPPITDQLDSMLKYFKAKKAGGETLPADLDKLVTDWEAVKTNNPKEGLVE